MQLANKKIKMHVQISVFKICFIDKNRRTDIKNGQPQH